MVLKKKKKTNATFKLKQYLQLPLGSTSKPNMYEGAEKKMKREKKRMNGYNKIS